MALHMEIIAPSLDVHPFLKQFVESNSIGMRKICHTAIREVSISQGDTLFSGGDLCEQMYVMVSGCLEYTFMRGGAEVLKEVRAKEWLCEASLWTSWNNCGL